VENEYNNEVVYPDSDEEDDSDDEAEVPPSPVTASSVNLRSMFHQVVSKVSTRVGGSSKEVLIGRFKHNLGSQLSLNEE
jgi:hypothetical protein